MSAKKRAPIRFGFLTVLVWLAAAAGSILLLWYGISRLSGSNLPVRTATPNQTQVNQTVAALVDSQTTLTVTPAPQTITPSPPARLTPTPPTLLPTEKMTSTPGGATRTPTATARCDLAGAGNPLDITIPDDSLIPAGEAFTKIWKLVNTGTCTWTTSYSASFFYGDRMGAPEAVPLPANVPPAQSVEISIEMAAPATPGTYQGNWKLMNPSGDLFGIGPNGDLPFWVRIIVPVIPSSTAPATATATGTPGATATYNPTSSPTSTSTPPVQASGELSLVPGDELDLDDLIVNAGAIDLLYHVDTDNIHWLTPVEEARIGVFGSLEPGLADCQSASMSHAPIAVESLPLHTYLCYFTNQDRFGRMLLEAVDQDDFTLTLFLLTWALP